MPKAVQIRNLPDEVHAALRVRAARLGLSLSEYLRQEVTALSQRPSLDEFLDATARPSSTVSTNEIVAAVRADRDGR